LDWLFGTIKVPASSILSKHGSKLGTLSDSVLVYRRRTLAAAAASRCPAQFIGRETGKAPLFLIDVRVSYL
jgi:hypothetical protein